MTAATLRQALEALREALARRSVDRPCLVRVPAPLARPERVWDADPRAPAMAFIAAHERHPRGWFSGPVGRVTPEGEGELAVALRSVLVRGRTAYVYAGAGIVAGSRAELELAETRAKARTCLAALGVHA